MVQMATPRGKWIGARVKRVEDPRFLTGDARYVADLTLPRMVHAAFVRSPYGHARIKGIDASAALAAPGVIAVITHADVASVPPLQDPIALDGLKKTPQTILASDKVRFVGEPVAVVIAEDRYLAEDAAELVQVDYEPLPAVTDAEAAMAEGAPLLFEDLGSNVVYDQTYRFGDPDSAFQQADRVFKKRLHTNRFMASPMETRGCIGQYDRGLGELTFWSSSQMPHMLRLSLAGFLGIPEQKIRVITPEVGGGFGQKMTLYPEEVVVAFLARHLQRPVKWIEDRRENLMSATHGKEQIIELEAAVKNDGTLLGLRATCIGDGGGYSFNTASALVEPQASALMMPGLYRVAHYEGRVVAVVTNKTPVGAFRAVGWTAGHTARELFFNEIARELGMDPVEFRRKNMIHEDELPYTTCTGQVYDSGSYVKSLDMALQAVGYDELRARQEELRAQGRYLGIGISPYVEPTAWGSEIALQVGFPFPSHDNARVSIEPSGKVTVAVTTHSHGQGHETTLAQVAADILGVDLADVTVVFGDTASTPWGMGTYASRSAVIGGGAVTLAAQEVREKILKIAGRMLEADPADLVLADGKVSVQGAPDRSVTLAEVAVSSYFVNSVRAEGEDPTLTATRFYDPKATYSNGCIVVVAEVDPETGQVRLDRVVSVEDCGTILNPMIVDGQIHGAVAQGIGGTLYEHLVYDDQGQLLTGTFMDYLLPTATEVPPIQVEHLETPSPVTVQGIKGMGEGGLMASPAAVAGAVIDALAPFNPKVEELPLSPERILRAIGTITD